MDSFTCSSVQMDARLTISLLTFSSLLHQRCSIYTIMNFSKRKSDEGPVYVSGNIPYNYIVVMDAGSSGSRIHIYHYPSRQSNESVSEIPHVSKSGNNWQKKTSPGISTFADKPEKVGDKHLKDLIKYAEKIVPKEQQARTPLFLHATGGMRLLDQDRQDAILGNACQYILEHSDFFVPDCASHFNVISGPVEGMFGWLAVNYLIGGIDNPQNHNHGKNHTTYGFLDMGGASTQVTFVPNITESKDHQKYLSKINIASMDGEHDLSYDVYSKSFLEMGVNEARMRYLRALLLEDKHQSMIYDPCSLAGFHDDEVDIAYDDEDTRTVEVIGTGDYQNCSSLLMPLLSDMQKESKPDFDFDVNHFVGVSEYWDSTKGFQLGGDLEPNMLIPKIESYCNQSWNDVKDNHKSEYEDWKLHDLESLCFKSSWILEVIRDGLGFPIQLDQPAELDGKVIESSDTLENYLSPLRAAEEINGVEFSWTLGRALLYASSELSPKTDHMGISLANSNDWLYGVGESRPKLNSDKVDDDQKQDSDFGGLLDQKSHRLWGSLIFLFILVIVVYLLLGRAKRHIIWQTIKTGISKVQSRSYERLSQTRSDAIAAETFELQDHDERENDGFNISDEEDDRV